MLYPVVLGTREAPVVVQRRGVRHKQIRKRIEKALIRFQEDVAEFRAAADAGGVPLRAAIVPPLRLYARLISIHPFVDGNGSTAWAVFCHALLRCGFLLVAIPPTPETRWALGMAIKADRRQEIEPLVDIVEQTIRHSSA